MGSICPIVSFTLWLCSATSAGEWFKIGQRSSLMMNKQPAKASDEMWWALIIVFNKIIGASNVCIKSLESHVTLCIEQKKRLDNCVSELVTFVAAVQCGSPSPVGVEDLLEALSSQQYLWLRRHREVTRVRLLGVIERVGSVICQKFDVMSEAGLDFVS